MLIKKKFYGVLSTQVFIMSLYVQELLIILRRGIFKQNTVFTRLYHKTKIFKHTDITIYAQEI